MHKINHYLYIKTVLSLVILALTACQPGSDSLRSPTEPIQSKDADSSQPQPAELVTPTRIDNSAVSTNAPPVPEGGISFEDLRESTPLAPVNLRASLSSQGVRLDWDPAPPVDFPHSYSDTIDHYNVYKGSAAEADLILLAETVQPYFIDQDAIPGSSYYYAVSAVHEGPVEGLRTDPLMWTHP
jgi:hypothetical protein